MDWGERYEDPKAAEPLAELAKAVERRPVGLRPLPVTSLAESVAGFVGTVCLIVGVIIFAFGMLPIGLRAWSNETLPEAKRLPYGPVVAVAATFGGIGLGFAAIGAALLLLRQIARGLHP